MKILLVSVSFLFLSMGCGSLFEGSGPQSTQPGSHSGQVRTSSAQPGSHSGQVRTSSASDFSQTPSGWLVTEEAQECIDEKNKELNERIFPDCDNFEAQYGVKEYSFKKKIDFFVRHEDRSLRSAWGNACNEKHELGSRLRHQCVKEFGKTLGHGGVLHLDDNSNNPPYKGPPVQKKKQ